MFSFFHIKNYSLWGQAYWLSSSLLQHWCLVVSFAYSTQKLLTGENKITFSQSTGGFKAFWRHSLLRLNPIFLISSTTSYQIMYQYSNVYLYLPSLKWKSKPNKLLWSFCLSPVFLQDIVPVFFRATFLRRVTWNKLSPLPHILFFLNSTTTWSFTPASASQLKLLLLSLASMLQHLTKMCMSSYLWDFL